MATTADVGVLWADFKQAIVDKAIDQWRKPFPAFMKAKGKHFERLLCCLDVLFQTLFKRLVIFVNTAFYA